MKKRGFTLVELLAVIVILAIILAIAVPGISSIINNATKNSFMDDAKMVIKAINYKLMNDSSFDVATIDETNANSILGISTSNYSDLIVTKNNDDIRVVITGKNKWVNLIAYGTYTDLQVADIPTGLVGYWNLDGNANDSSGNGNNGTVFGATLAADNKGRANSAYYFDGTDDYISAGNNGISSLSQGTVSFWVKLDTDRTTEQHFLDITSIQNFYSNTGWFVGPTGPYTSVVIGDIRGSWHHLAYTFSSSTVSLYLDGILKNSSSTTFSYASSPNVKLGCYHPGGLNMKGYLDDARIYNRALTADEIKVLYDINK